MLQYRVQFSPAKHTSDSIHFDVSRKDTTQLSSTQFQPNSIRNKRIAEITDIEIEREK